MKKILFIVFWIFLSFGIHARTLDDIRNNANNILVALEQGEIHESNARELLDELEKEALFIHQRNNAQAAEMTNRQERQNSTPIVISERQSTPQRTNEVREPTPSSNMNNSTQLDSNVNENTTKVPGGIGFMRRFISFAWLWDVLLFIGYAALGIGAIAIAVTVYEIFNTVNGSIARSTQNRNPTIQTPQSIATVISPSRPTSPAPQRPQQTAATGIPHSGEVPNYLC